MFKKSRKPAQATKRTPTFVPRVEQLEDRCLLSTFSVINTHDDGVGSLRQAINDANVNHNAYGGVPDRIIFDIPGDDDVYTITPGETDGEATGLGALPAITDPVEIDGYSQPGSHANTLTVGDDAVLRIELNGAKAGAVDGLTITAGGSTVRGLVINGFQKFLQFGGRGIVIQSDGVQSKGNNFIQGNFLGTNAQGTAAVANRNSGVWIDDMPNNTIGGTDPADRNIISGNGLVNIDILSARATGNTVQGNYIGTNAAGTSMLGAHDSKGVVLDHASHNTIGGTAPGSGNVVSGHYNGIDINASENTVQGNFIGLDASGTNAIPNQIGVYVVNTFGNIIGGDDADDGTPDGVVHAGNIIAGNIQFGIQLASGATVGQPNYVQGNFIGTDVTGKYAVGNGIGVMIGDEPAPNVLGGARPDRAISGNLISGNVSYGVLLSGRTRTVIQGNRIGTQADGVNPLGNGNNGIYSASANGGGNTIGGTGLGEGNVIAFNAGAGVVVRSLAAGTPILGNSIHSNRDFGIDLINNTTQGSDGVTANDPDDIDTGPNNLQNFPVLTDVAATSTQTSITGILDSTPNAVFRIEFFANAGVDPAGFGEGQTFLRFKNVTTDASGHVAFTADGLLPLPVGQAFVTATATSASNDTSEFSPILMVTASNQAPVLDPVPDQSVKQGQRLNLHVSATDPDSLSAVVSFANDSHFFGSGVLISPTTVLTAAHVQQLISDGATTVSFGDGAVVRTVAHSVSTPNFNFPENDLAIVTLDSPVDITPLALYRSNLELGLQTFLAGYGESVLHFGENRVTDVDSSRLFFDTRNPNAFQPLHGDSGGPALINGQVAGVASFIFTGGYAYTRTGHFLSFIDQNTPGDPTTRLTLTFALVDGPTGSEFDASMATFTWNPGADVLPETYFAKIRVTDNGASPLSDEITVAIEVLPGEPTVDVGSDARIPEGSTFSSHGSFAFFGDQALSARVSYGDGTPPQNLPLDRGLQSFELNHHYPSDGFFRVTVTIIGDVDCEVSGSTTVRVDDVAPRADAGGPYVFQEGSIFTLDASGSSDPGNDIVLYEWGFDEDTFYSGTGRTFSSQVPYLSAGVYSISLRVTDDDAVTSETTATFTVTPAPVLDAVDDSLFVTEGSGSTAIDVLANDVSIVPELPITIISITPAEHGSVTLRSHGRGLAYTPDSKFHGIDGFSYTIEDGLGERDTAYVFVRVNGLPTAAFTATPDNGRPPLTVRLNGAGSTDPDSDDSITLYHWDFGDGHSADTNLPGVGHAYAHFGRFTAQLTVVDSFHGTSQPVTMNILVDTPPIANLTATPATGPAPLPVTLDGRASSDPDTGDSVTTYLWNFGDGTTVINHSAITSHVYKGVRDYHPTLTVVDTLGVASGPVSAEVRTFGSISGSVYEDFSGTGQNIPSGQMGGIIVYVDLDQDGRREFGEPFVATFSSGPNKGAYAITVPGGTGIYQLRIELPASTIVTRPIGTIQVVDLTNTGVATNLQFGLFKLGTIQGIVFNDINGNGTRQSTEPGIPGQKLFLDADGDGVPDDNEPVTVSGANGNYSFFHVVGPGSLGLYPVFAGAYFAQMVTNNNGGGLSADLFMGSGSTRTLTDLGIFTRGSASGIVYEDLNGNGVLDAPTEHGIPGRTVFVDSDLSHVPGFQSAITDAQGHYELNHLLDPGAQPVMQVLPPGWNTSQPQGIFYSVTATSGSTSSGNNFGTYRPVTIAGRLFEDLNGDGAQTRDEPGLSNWTVFLDIDQDGTKDDNEPRQQTNSLGEYSFGNLRPKLYRVREELPSGWTAQNPATRFRDITLTSGQTPAAADFANYRPASITGRVFDDVNGQGILDDTRLAGRTVFLDTDNNGAMNGNETRVVTDTRGKYTLDKLKPGHYYVRTLPTSSNEILTAPTAGVYEITVVSNQTAADRDFGLFTLGVINVSVREDRNGDGSVPTPARGVLGDPLLAGWRVFLDLNHDGLFGGEPDRITAEVQDGVLENATFRSLLAGTYDVRLVAQDGWVATTPIVGQVTITSGTVSRISFGEFKLGTIAGKVGEWRSTLTPPVVLLDSHGPFHGLPGRVVFLDTNNNGRLDDDETSSVTDSNGDYTLANVGPGLQHLRELLPVGWISSPASAEQQLAIFSGRTQRLDATVSSNFFSGATYFRNKHVGAITGTVFADGQSMFVGRPDAVIYVDANNNGALDAGESSGVTDTAGQFAVTTPVNSAPDRKAQEFTIRIQLPFGFRMDAPGVSFRTISIPVTDDILDFAHSDFGINSHDQPVAFDDAFSRGNSSLLGDDWREVTGDLSIHGSNLRGSGGAVTNVAIFNSLPQTDVDLQAKVILLDGVSLNLGLIARYQETTGDMYVGLLIRRQGQTFAEIHKIVDGQTTVLASTVAGSSTGILRFSVVGIQLTLSLGSHVLATATDLTPIESGQVGVFLGSQNLFDDFHLEHIH